MYRSLYRHPSGSLLTDLEESQLALAATDRRGLLWVDMQQPTDEEYSSVLTDLFSFHPLAVDDVVDELHSPKLDDYGSYLFIVFHTITLGNEKMDIRTDEIDVFLGAQFLVTIHKSPRPAIDRLWQDEMDGRGPLEHGPSMLLYTLLEQQVDHYAPVIEEFEERLEQLGNEMFVSQGPDDKEVLTSLLSAKSSALRLRRILIPQRNLLDRLSSQDYAVVPQESRRYFRDVYDHLARLADLADSTRDLATMTNSTYLALTNIRMNEVMKVLTIIATIFMPLSFLAGVYGMNFTYMPELQVPWAYPLIWALFIGIAGAILWFYIRRRWM